MEKLRKFLDESDRLILQHIISSRIRKSHIKHVATYRESIADYPLAVQYLDELIEFAEVLNDKGAIEAQPYADKAMASLDAISERVANDGRI